MGALTQAPKHYTSIQEHNLFSESLFSSLDIFSLQIFTILSAPLIRHGLVVQTCTNYFPTGAR